MRAAADARIGDDQIGRAKALDEIARRRLGGLGVGDIERVSNDRAGKRAADRAARDQREDGVGGSVVPRQRFSDTGGSAGDDDFGYLPFRTWSTRKLIVSIMPCWLRPWSALTV
jgi:hypothetical protein